VCTATSTPATDGGGATDGGAVDGGTDAGTGAVEPTHPLEFIATISPDPAQLGRNILTVQINGANGIPVTGATLQVVPFMTTHGHGSSENPVVTENGAGSYTAQRVTFTMSGTWRVTLTATSGALSGTKVLYYSVN
jgi:hypothetical protein